VVGAKLGEIADAVRNMLPFFAAALWLAGTAWSWRSLGLHVSAATLAGTTDMEQWLVCPRCGYSLIGLREVRCPECGWNTTVDDVVRRSLFEALEST
jgi:ribosomal protein L37E